VVTVGGVVAVSIGAAVFAHAFRESILAVAHALGGAGGSVEAARAIGPGTVFVLVTFGVTTAAWIGRVAQRRYGEHLGLCAIAAAARDDRPAPTFGGSALRAAATWVATSSLASLGREAPIMETGGTLGNVVGRLVGRPGHRLAVTGIAAAFAVAYHAPVAAVLYVEQHLGMRHDRRTVAHAVAGSVIGFLVAQQLFDSRPILPSAIDPLSRDAIAMALVGVLPAYAASRIFLEARDRLAAHPPSARRASRRALLLAMIVGIVVALVPLTAGNGMEALRASATTGTAGIAFALLIGKLVATTAAVGSGAPGGVVSPSLAVAGGAALASFLALDLLGIQLGGSKWDGILIAMAVGVAISVRSPLVALVMVAEMAGDARVLPLTALAVGVAIALDRVVDHVQRIAGKRVPIALHDEDG
jgi:CIC family chloride channel protein